MIGAAAGYLYYYYIGCYSGTCPITGNPCISTGYGALAGLVFTKSGKKVQKDNNKQEA
jgi:hypothetical protein